MEEVSTGGGEGQCPWSHGERGRLRLECPATLMRGIETTAATERPSPGERRRLLRIIQENALPRDESPNVPKSTAVRGEYRRKFTGAYGFALPGRKPPLSRGVGSLRQEPSVAATPGRGR